MFNSISFGMGGFRMFQRHVQLLKNNGKSGSRKINTSASSSGTPTGSTQSSQLHPVIKSGLISGSLSLAGDLIAQLLMNLDSGTSTSVYDPARAARMGTFGLFFYGPYQHYWYRALDRAMPARNIPNFIAKVSLNQLCLAPLVIAAVFAWNLGLQGKISEWNEKTKRDFVPTILTGWKFWVPAASINFLAVPLPHQVLYMSGCGVVWTGYLSYSSAKATQEVPSAAAAATKTKKK